MSRNIIGFIGSPWRPSKARRLVEAVAEKLAANYGFQTQIFDLVDAGPDLAVFPPGRMDAASRKIVEAIEQADGLIIGCPVFQGSYPGLFKHVFDMVRPGALRNRPVLLTATGGGQRHSLVVEHQLRPLFGFFEAATISTAVYACADEIPVEGDLPELLCARISNATQQFAAYVNHPAVTVAC